MLQISQNLRDGATAVQDTPAPRPVGNQVSIRTRASLLSAGTERMLVEFGRAGWIDKARQQPDKVRQVLEKVKTDGLAATLESVRAKLDQPVALGYCNVGAVIESLDPEFAPGDRVASNGAHAEVVCIGKNLCARVPDSVTDEQAAFMVLGAIGLQGVRLAQPTLGETFAVMGVGLIGLLAVQILRAAGCRVIGIDPDARRLELASRFGAETCTADTVVDGVLITASTSSSEPVHQAAELCRKKGRIVLVGVTGLELSRDDFYKKEISFQISCSYGPGRYDEAYEEHGQDYPLPYVRWTEKRNFETVLQLMAEGKLDVAPLITHRFPFDRAESAYEVIVSREPHLGILLEYASKPETALVQRTLRIGSPASGPAATGEPTVALIGTGQHALRTLLPAMQNSGASLHTIADRKGVIAAHAARKFGFAWASTDSDSVLADSQIDTVLISTRHDTHARLVCAALRSGKSVYVEKPLALRQEELDEIEAVAQGSPGILMVGFNRRFAPQIVKMRELLRRSPDRKAVVITINAGFIPTDHWTQDPRRGGGRIIGEACHFVDLVRFLADAPIRSSAATRLNVDTVSISLSLEDGSTGAVHYFANGHRSFPKERIEVFCGGRILQLDNFRRLSGWGWPRFRKMHLWRQDKGHAAAVAAFLAAVRAGAPSPIPLDQLLEVSRMTIQAASQ